MNHQTTTPTVDIWAKKAEGTIAELLADDAAAILYPLKGLIQLVTQAAGYEDHLLVTVAYQLQKTLRETEDALAALVEAVERHAGGPLQVARAVDLRTPFSFQSRILGVRLAPGPDSGPADEEGQ